MTGSRVSPALHLFVWWRRALEVGASVALLVSFMAAPNVDHRIVSLDVNDGVSKAITIIAVVIVIVIDVIVIFIIAIVVITVVVIVITIAVVAVAIIVIGATVVIGAIVVIAVIGHRRCRIGASLPDGHNIPAVVVTERYKG